MEKHKIVFVGFTTGGGVATIHNSVLSLFKDDTSHQHFAFNLPPLPQGVFKKSFEYIKQYFRFSLFIVKYSPGSVYLQISQTGYFHQVLFLLIAKLFLRRTIAHFHAKPDIISSTNIIQKQLILISRHFVDDLIVLTDRSKETLIALGWNKRIYVIPNFICTTSFDAMVLEPIEKRNIILYLGRMLPQKGINTILEVAQSLQDKQFVFIGNFESSSDQQEFIYKLKAIKNAQWIGPIYGEQKYEYIAKSKLFLFPTRWSGEVFPLTLVETALFGVIPIVNPMGSIPTIIENNVNGIILPSDAPKDIASIIERIWNDAGLLQKMSGNSLKIARSKYTGESVRQKIFEIVYQ